MQGGIIPDEVVERVRSGTDIVELVSGYVALRRTGANYSGLCPFHTEKTPSFTVSPSKQIYHCFGCGAGGDAVGFLMRQENLAFPEAIRRLADRAGIIIPETAGYKGRDRGEYDALAKVNEAALGYFVDCLWKSAEGGKARKYLESRGMAGEAARRFEIGYSRPGWDGLLKYLEKKGHPAETAVKAGLALKKTSGQGSYDRFRDRVMFPIRDMRGRVIGFGGRTMGDELPKYLNSPETPLFRKGETLYAVDAAAEHIRKKGYSVVVEGYFDAIACHMAGVDNAVATMGTALTPGHLRLLGRQSKNVLLVFDSDAAGIKAAERSLDVFLGTDMAAKVALLPPGDDPDSLFRREGPGGLADRLKASERLMDFVIKRAARGADTVEGKMSAVAALTAIIARMENSVERAHYLKRCAEELSVEESAVREEFEKKKTRTGTFRGPERPRLAGMDKIEEDLLHAMLCSDEAAAMARAELAPEDFSDPAVRGVVERLFALLGGDGRVDAPRLLEALADEGQKKAVLRLSVKEPVEDITGMAEGAVKRLRQAKADRGLSELESRVKKAQEEGDDALAGELTVRLLKEKRARIEAGKRETQGP